MPLTDPSPASVAAPDADASAPAAPHEPRHSTLDEEAPRSPASLGELFIVFSRLALQGFGGVLPIAQRELVERQRWLTREQFVELLSVAAVLPGPNVVNLSLMYGDRTFGWRGGVVALAGMLLAPLGVVLALTVLYAHFSQVAAVAGALRGMGAVAAGLIFSTGVKLAPALRRNALGAGLAFTLAGAMFVAMAVVRVPLIWVLAVLGGLSCALAWRRLKP
jgi:chromate transporter